MSEDAALHNRECAKARVAALNRLAKLHRDDYERLRDEERERRGLGPAGPARVRST